MKRPVASPALDVDILKDLVQTAVVECEHALMELQAQHTKLQKDALHALVDGVARACAERARAKEGDRENSLPTTVNSALSKIISSENSFSSEWVVETMLPNGSKFRTLEPPEMEANHVPKLNMASVAPERTGQLTPDGPVAQAQRRMGMTPSLTMTVSSTTESDSCDWSQFDPDPDERCGGRCDGQSEAMLNLPIPFHDDDPLQHASIPMVSCQPPVEEPAAFHECVEVPLEMNQVCDCGQVWEESARFCTQCGAPRKQAFLDQNANGDPLELDEPAPMAPPVAPPVAHMMSAGAKTSQAGVVKIAGQSDHAQKPILKDSQLLAPKACPSETAVHWHPSVPVVELQAFETDADTCEGLQVVALPSEPEVQRQPMEKREAHWGFDTAVGLLIIFSASTVGVEASDVAAGRTIALVRAAQILILLGFVWELVVRLRVIGIRAASMSPWIMLDVIAICGGWVHLIIQLASASATLRTLCVVQLLRMARLPCLARRLVRWVLWRARAPAVEQLHLEGVLVGILSSILVAAVAFVGFLYVWAVLGMHVIQSDIDFGEDYKAAADAYFGNLWRSLLTLVSAYTLDGVSSIYTPLVVARPALALYFGPFLLVGSLLSLSVLVGAVAEVLAWGKTPQASPGMDATQTGKAGGSAQAREFREYIDMADRLDAIEDSVRDLTVRAIAYPALLHPLFEKRDPGSPEIEDTLEI